LPTLLPTLTPRPTFTPTATSTLLPTFTITATPLPASATPTADPNATATPTATLDPVSLYKQSIPLCESAFDPAQVLTTTVPGAHLPTFILLNRIDEGTLWEPLQGMEWIDAETVSSVHAITCIRQTRRLDATYADQAVGYTLRWDIRLVSWPEGWLIGSETFWGEGPSLQNLSGGTLYGTPPVKRLLTWIACDLHPQPFTILCGSGGPLAFSPDSQSLITGQYTWEIASGQPITTGMAAVTPVTAVAPATIANILALSPDGSLIASAGSGERDILLRQANGQTIGVLKGHTGEITGLAFSPDGLWLLSASQEGNLFVWDIQTGKRLQVLAENLGWIHAVAISPDGKLVAAATWSQPGLIYLWDWQAALHAENATITPLQTIEASKIYVNALAFSPDSLLLASAGLDGNVKLWDVASALGEATGTPGAVRLVGLLQDHTSSVISLAFSPDGKSLASGSDDTRVIVWDVAKGTSRRVFPGAPGGVISVAFSPDGAWLAASSAGLIRLWPSP
jgi:dipeptidyl aminopeptidase/acylaminoacyl peptidase